MMDKTWNILYRGELSSCNYACDYCPFAKTKNSREELRLDAEQLYRFERWIASRTERVGVLFTPWGEGLIRHHYQEVMIRLSHLPHVYRVAIQTNLSCGLDWMRETNRDSFALWTTFHPSQISLEAFLSKCERLLEMGVRFSVGTVGLREDMPVIRELRKRLPDAVYLWVNAYKDEGLDYYTEGEKRLLSDIDPHFHWNLGAHASRGKPCRAGHTSFTVNGHGDVSPCHFVQRRLGNIYEDDIRAILAPSLCPNTHCDCHIGYVHLEDLKQEEIYGDGILERVVSTSL